MKKIKIEKLKVEWKSKQDAKNNGTQMTQTLRALIYADFFGGKKI
jgi:hypothetical protein